MCLLVHVLKNKDQRIQANESAMNLDTGLVTSGVCISAAIVSIRLCEFLIISGSRPDYSSLIGSRKNYCNISLRHRRNQTSG